MKAFRILVVGVLIASGAVALAGPASAATTSTCTGTFSSPGLLSGKYVGNVVISGVCFVDGAPAVVTGNVTVLPNSALNATFALDDVDGSGTTGLTVFGNVSVGAGALVGLGCEPEASPCSDDPDANEGGTLTGLVRIHGNLTAVGAAGAIVHATRIGGSVSQTGGGVSLSCDVPESGPFSALESPPFSDYEDNMISGNLTVQSVRSCWFGALRNTVANATFNRLVMGDPDANENLTNRVLGNLACSGNNPVVQYGDSGGSPNQVVGSASGECGFNVYRPDPAPSGPPTPISVHV